MVRVWTCGQPGFSAARAEERRQLRRHLVEVFGELQQDPATAEVFDGTTGCGGENPLHANERGDLAQSRCGPDGERQGPLP
ncbi:hypothetical protein AB0A63_07065 [Lentzea sp. NPDC042327]|uniref:hypothetical protein n=1 Tax=Lentzea sp. NPDC042327 TaxID=3154801 RepID=UPI0033CC7C49